MSAQIGFSLTLQLSAVHPLYKSTGIRQAPKVRTLRDLRPVLRDPEAVGPSVVYWMYRGAGPEEYASNVLALQNLRYDVTVLRSGLIGGEYVKTFGHVHPPAPDGLSYPELYQVVFGRAWFVLQKRTAGGVNVRIVRASAGDSVLIPPGFGHVSVNIGNTPLVLCNLVADGFQSDYGWFRRCRGAGVYVVAINDGHDGQAKVSSTTVQPGLELNPSYNCHVEINQWPPVALSELGLGDPGEPLFTAVCRQPQRFRFLTRPGDYPELWVEE